MTLEPVDLLRCQVFTRPGSFMILGPRPWERCQERAAVVVREVRPGLDGLRGAMSMCQTCLQAFKAKTPGWKKTHAIAKVPASPGR